MSRKLWSFRVLFATTNPFSFLFFYLHVGHLVSVIETQLALPSQHCVYLPLALLWEMRWNNSTVWCDCESTDLLHCWLSHYWFVFSVYGPTWWTCLPTLYVRVGCEVQEGGEQGVGGSVSPGKMKVHDIHGQLLFWKRGAIIAFLKEDDDVTVIPSCAKKLHLLSSPNRPYPVHPGSSRQSLEVLRLLWSFCARQTRLSPVFYKSDDDTQGSRS